jgi:DNA repair exonuclease SbcCD ATPase subunit
MLAAIHLLGPHGVAEAVYGSSAEGVDAPGQERRAEELERRLQEVQQELGRQRRQNAAVEARLEELASRLESGAVSMPQASTPAARRADELQGVLGDLQTEVGKLGEQLGRQWDESSGISYADLAATPAERLNRRVGALEARLAEVAGMVGAPYGGYPPAPDPSVGEDERLEWVAEVVGMLQHQLVEVTRRAARFRQASGGSRGTAETAG